MNFENIFTPYKVRKFTEVEVIKISLKAHAVLFTK